MPRAVSDKVARVHQSAAPLGRASIKAGTSRNAAASSSTMRNSSDTTRNPIFNTDRFGQHILKNPLVAQSIVDKASLKPTDVVLEVGPGTGNLTVRILEQAKKTVVVEMDPRMAAELTKRVQGKPEQRKLEILIGDFCKTELPYFDVCISNTPYQISSPLVFKLLSHRPLFRTAILMFQREFAQRLTARPGSVLWCRLSANVQLYAQVSPVLSVSRNSFRPPPQVESSVVRISPLNPPPKVEFDEYDGMNRIVFSRRNKTIRASFFGAKGVLDMMEKNYKTWCAEREQPLDTRPFAARVEAILDDTGYTENRAAKMDIDDLLKLLSAFHDAGIHFS